MIYYILTFIGGGVFGWYSAWGIIKWAVKTKRAQFKYTGKK